jgi:ubiquinone biosynthesis protein UbiJ
MGFAPLLLVVVALAPTAQATHESAVLNPIRKVVTLLQSMQTKVEAEGEKEEELFKKFMCYCKTSSGALTDSIAAADYKATSLTSEIKVLSEQQAALKEALPIVKADRAAAKAAMADGTALREKDAAAYAAEKATDDADVAAINKAIAALAKGMAGAFLQTGTAQVLRKIVTSMSNVLEADRQDVLSFLGGTQGSEYAPQSGEIEGILKQMAESMSKGSAEATAEEEAAIKTYEELMAAKKKEVAALTESVETKTAKLGELGVAIVQGKDDMTETEKSAAADKKFAATMKTSCATKEAEWAEIEKTRSEELIALAETIKVLNDDDALELFKKTLPSAASSFLQVGQSMASTKARALSALNEARLHAARPERAHLDLIALALHGKKIGFDKLIEMIDKMVETLKKEQTDDESKKEYCGNQFDMADDKKKGLEQAAGDAEALIESAKEGIVTIKEELAALEAGIKELDKSVAEATQQRKDENVEFKAMMASDSASKELLAFAKNRLNKFYNACVLSPLMVQARSTGSTSTCIVGD